MIESRRENLNTLSFSDLFMIGLQGTVLASEEKSFLMSHRPGGVILFRRNIESPDQVRELISSIHDCYAGAVAPLIAVDQEGGIVARLREPFTVFPGNDHLGRAARVKGDEGLTSAQAEVMGRELAWAGFNLDFAPVADVNTHPDNPIIGPRAFGEDVETVVRHVQACVRGFQASHMLSCAKHYPGHGHAQADSHLALPTIDVPPEVLKERELRPFQAAIEADCPMIMTAHCLYSQWDEKRPATLSRSILSHLRQEMGFQGVICSDDMEMKALDAYGTIAENSVEALRAGVDLVLICKDLDWAGKALEACSSESWTKEEHDQFSMSRSRMATLRTQQDPLRPASGALDVAAWAPHRALASEIRDLGSA